MNDQVAPEIQLAPGDPAPWFSQNASSGPQLALDGWAGRYVVLCFFGAARQDGARAAIDAALAHGRLFDDRFACFFGVSIDPQDEAELRARQRLPGVRFFLDGDRKVSRLSGAVPRQHQRGQGPVSVRQFWIVLDPMRRVLRW